MKGERVALLIGAPNGLGGVIADVGAVARALEDREFRCERCVAEEATREGIWRGEGRRIRGAGGT